MSKKAVIILPLLFAAGVFIRLLSGSSVLHTDLVYSPGRKEKPPGSRTPADAVKSFYLYLKSGDYEKAWEISLEPDWADRGGGVEFRDEVSGSGRQFSGWTGKEAFVQRMKAELGPFGSKINLRAVEAEIIGVLDAAPFAEAYGFDKLENAFMVKAWGNLLGACSVFRWEKELVVLEVGKRYRVLLGGTKPKNSWFYQSWFSNLTMVGTLRRSAH